MTPSEYDNKLTPEQRIAMQDLQKDSGYTWSEFLEKCTPPTLLTPYVGVNNFHGMFVGIEPDGYTHT